jgi:histidinol-phosphate aminotransferase
MPLSRRNLLKAVGLGVAAGTVPFLSTSPSLALESSPSAQADGPILLNSTENAYGPSAKVMAALASALPAANRYAHQEYENLADQIAGLDRVRRDQVLLGCGSSEILRMSAGAFLGAGKKLVVASPTFEAMAHYAEASGADIVRVPLNRQHGYDLGAMLARANAPGVVYISNPNNPTGTLTSRKDLETFISKLPASVHVVIDEAYHHYAGASPSYASFIERPVDDRRVIVTRTFSKIYGMAGMRLGYGVASIATISEMRPYQLQFNVNTIAARAGIAALDDAAGVATAARRNGDDRVDFINRAQTRNYNPIPSHTNFVMMDTELPTEGIIEHFRKNSILVGGPFAPMNTFVRVSLGTPAQMEEFWRVWDLMHIEKSHH